MSYSPTATSSLHLDDFETRNMMDESQADFPPDDQQRILHELIQRNTQGISGQSDEHFDANNNSRPSTGTGSPQSRLSAPLTQIPASNTDANLVSAMKYFNNLEHLLKNGLNDLGMYKSEANRFLVEKQREFAELTNAAAKIAQEKEKVQNEAQRLLADKDAKIQQLSQKIEQTQQQFQQIVAQKDAELRCIRTQLMDKDNEMEIINQTNAALASEMEEWKLQGPVVQQPPVIQHQPRIPPPQPIIMNNLPQSIQDQILAKEGENKILRDKMEGYKEEIASLRTELVKSLGRDKEVRSSVDKEIERLKTQLIFKEDEMKTLQNDYNILKNRFDAINEDEDRIRSRSRSPARSPPRWSTADEMIDSSKKRKSVKPRLTPSKSARLIPVTMSASPPKSPTKSVNKSTLPSPIQLDNVRITIESMQCDHSPANQRNNNAADKQQQQQNNSMDVATDVDSQYTIV